MKYLIYLILLIVLLALNMEASRLFGLGLGSVNLLLFPCVFAALEKRDEFLFLAFTGGMFLDFYGSAPFGSFLFSLLLVSSALHLAAKTFWVYELNWRSVAVFLAISYIISQGLVWVFSGILPGARLYGFGTEFGEVLIKTSIGTILQLLAALPAYALWRFTLKVVAKTEIRPRI